MWARPNLDRLWAAFPDHVSYPTLKDLYTMLGGKAAQNTDAPGFGPNGNTCASRLSVAFNRGGTPITRADALAVLAQTLTAGDGTLIIFRISEFRKYLIRTLGEPKLDKTSPYDNAFQRKKGIVAFSVHWVNATGHIALWNGATYREPGHDNYATYIDPTNPKVRTSLGEFWGLS